MPASLTRRALLGGLVGAAGIGALAACSSVVREPQIGGDPGERLDDGRLSGSIRFAFWGGSPGEEAGFAFAKQAFEREHPGTRIDLQVLPYSGFFAAIDRGLRSDTGPDVFRVDYTTLGKYTSHGVLLDMTPYLEPDAAERFLPALWRAVTFDDRPYGVPHQTDTTAVVYDLAAFEQAGITSVPTTLEDAWTWQQFGDVAATLRDALPDDRYPFAYPWTAAGAYRWNSFLYQAGGRLLTPDLSAAALPSDEAAAALDFTKRFFDERWVPANNTVKTTVYSDVFFLTQVVPMSLIGNFSLPSIADAANGYQGDWGVTYLPRDVTAASDLGGNAVVASRATENPELAAAFLRFLVRDDVMQRFCEEASQLPTLRSLQDVRLDYAVAPDAMPVFERQATMIGDTVVEETTVAAFGGISTVLQDRLEAAFRGASTDATLEAMATGIDAAIVQQRELLS